MKIALLVFVIVVVLVGIFLVVSYNKLVRFRQNVREAWSAIDTELRRRYDLIPNLVETVKGYATHEKETLENVIKARNAAIANTGTPEEQAKTETQLTGALRQVFALSEAYPDLKANTNFMQLQAQLEETENRLGQSRRCYNANVRELNTATETFPSVVVANMFGFKPESYFEVEEEAARGPVSVKF